MSLSNVTAATDASTQRESVARALLRRPAAAGGIVVLAILVVCALWPTGWLPHDVFNGDQADRFLPPFFLPGAKAGFPLGTDSLGRDILSMLIAGSRYTLMIVVCAAAIGLVIGVVAGLISGYFGGWLDAVIMRIADIQLAFPAIVLIIAVVAAFGPSVLNLIVILGVIGWAPYARLVRGTVLGLRAKEFVEAAVITGAGNRRIIFGHLLPNTSTSIIVFLTSDLARLVLLEASLSFLGLGVQPPTPSWGLMIADGRQYIYDAWWASTLPGIVIVLAVLAFSFVGDELRDVLDPTMRRS